MSGSRSLAWRLALLCCLSSLSACGGSTELEGDDMLAPWHMWGNQLPINLIATGAPADVVSSQLVRINYGRPETWSWLFWAQVLSDTGAGDPGVIQVRFNLILGVGRTALTMNDFVVFAFGAPLPTPTLRYTTSTTDPEGRILSDFPSEDIQLNVNSIVTGGAAPGTAIQLQVGAFFSPKSHIRPEWYEGQFRGDEDKGH
jgi:hypothetical protein